MTRDLIVDANSLWARAYYASKGQEPPAHVAMKMVLGLLNPNTDKIGKIIHRTLFCWDGASKTVKKRPVAKPEDYHPKMAEFKDLLTDLLGAAHATPPDDEADDAVATAVFRDSENELYVVSGDKDIHQLCGGNTTIYSLSEGSIIGSNFISKRWGVKRPSQVSVAIAIIGDSGDGISGIKGWGPKKVKRIFEDVTEDMPLGAVIELVESQLNPAQLEQFQRSLAQSILYPDVPDVPHPGELRLRSPDSAWDQLGDAFPSYARVYDAYHGITTEETMTLIDEF